jgi:hypothetical protein
MDNTGGDMKDTFDTGKNTDETIKDLIYQFQQDHDSIHLIIAYTIAHMGNRPVPEIVSDHLCQIFTRFLTGMVHLAPGKTLDELFGFMRGKLMRDIMILKRGFSLSNGQACAMVELKHSSSSLFHQDLITDTIARLADDKLRRKSFTKRWDRLTPAFIDDLLKLWHGENLDNSKKMYLLEYPKEAFVNLPEPVRQQYNIRVKSFVGLFPEKE